MCKKLSMSNLLCVFIRASVLVTFFLISSTTPADAQRGGTRTGAFVYTGGNGYSGSSAPVSGYAINTTSGTLSLVSGSPFGLPGRLVSITGDPTGKFVYVTTDDGSLSAFTVDSQAGSLTPVAGSPYTAPTGGSSYWGNGKLLAIDPAGKYLYVAGGSQLYGFSIDAGSGALTAISGSPFALSASAVAVDPSDQYLAVYNGSGVQSYTINSGTGALTAAGTRASGCGGSHMTFEPSGHFLYGTTGSGIAACSFDSSSGALAAVTGSPFATSSGASFMGVAAHPSGSFLYATDSTCVDSGPQNRLYGFVIDPSSGALTAIGGSPFALPGGGGCNYDFDVAAEASGNFVYTVDANDGIAAYKVTAATGALTQASSSFTGPAAMTLATVPNAMSSTATVTGVEITPATTQITTSSLGKQVQFTLKVTYSDGSTGFLTRSASWSSSDTTVATVTSGLATSTGYGTVTITATIDGLPATASLTVVQPVLSSISITPQTVTVYQGTAIQLTATGKYADGSSIDVTSTVTWSSSNTSAATVSAAGQVLSVGLGTFTISATLQSVTGTTSVTIVPPFVWQTPAPITYGTVLGPAQLNATSGVSGTFTYNPPSGTLLPAGSQSLNVAFAPDSSASSLAHRSIAGIRGAVRLDANVTPFDSGNPLAAAATVTLVVNQAALSLTANNQSMSYGSAVPTLTGALSGVVASDGITASYSTTATSTSGPGSYPITAKLNDPNSKISNYTVTNTPGTLTIGKATATVSLSNLSTTYTGSALGATATTTPANLNVTITYTQNGKSVTSPITVGTYGVVATINDADYSGTAAGTLTVSQTPLSVTTNNQSISYGSAVPTLTGTLSGVIAADGITVSYSTPATSTSVPGAYPITAKLNDPSSKLSNYAVTNTPGTLTISKETATVSLSNLSTTYTGSALGATATTTPANLNVTITYTQNGNSITSPITAGSYGVAATINDPNYSGAATGTLTIKQASPTLTWATPAAISFGTALSSTQLDATAAVPGAFVYTPAAGSIPSVGNDTLAVVFTPTDTTDYTTATASVTLLVNLPSNPAPVIGSISPAFTDAGATAFPITITGTGFASSSTAYWGTTALSTQYVSATQLTAQITASEVASAGIAAVTVQSPAPGGGTSGALQFEIDSTGSGSGTAPTFSSLTASVAPGSTATYPVTLPSSATNVSVSCLNLPGGATCTYSATTKTVTISTTAASPSGTYQITVIFTETLPGTATAQVLLPILLLPLLLVRRKMAQRGIWFTACLALVLLAGMACSTGCGGGGTQSTTPATHQVTSSGTVSLTIQ